MADSKHGISLIIEVLDKFTAPFRGMAGSVDKVGAVLKRLHQQLVKVCNVTGITALNNRLKQLHSSVAGLGSAAQGALGKLAMVGLSGGGLLWGFKRAFVDDAAAAEQLTLSLHSVAGGAEKAAAEYARLSGFANRNAQDIAGVATAYKAVRQAGGQASDELLKKMGDAAAGNKKSFEEVGAVIAAAMKGEVGGVEGIDPTVKARDLGNKLLFTWEENGKKMHAAVSKRNKQLIADTLATLWSKKHKGAMDTYGQTWDGMLARIGAVWKKFTSLVMASGAFDHLKKKLGEIVAKIEEMTGNGELEAWAEETGKELVRLFDKFEEGVKEGWKWLKWLSDKVGGWSNLFLAALGAVALFIGGPLLVALALVGKAVILLGATLMATQIGWFLAACAGIAGLAYIIWDQWEPISKYFTDMWNEIKAAFDQGWVQGVFKILEKCNPLRIIMDGINGLMKYLFGVDLYAEGEKLFTRFWDGMKGVWDKISGWFQGKFDELTNCLPDWLKEELGISVNTTAAAPSPELSKQSGLSVPSGTDPAKVFGSGNEAGEKAAKVFGPGGDLAGVGEKAAAAIEQASNANLTALQKASLKGELIIRGQMPPGFSVEATASQGNMRVDKQGLGPMMAGG